MYRDKNEQEYCTKIILGILQSFLHFLKAKENDLKLETFTRNQLRDGSLFMGMTGSDN